MTSTALHWLPEAPDWGDRLRQIDGDPGAAWPRLVSLATTRMDFVRTDRLDRALRRLMPDPPPDLATRPIRLAMLGSSTLAHLHGAIRVAALRRGIWVNIYESGFGQYRQELLDARSELHRFRPDMVLLALDCAHVTHDATSQTSFDERLGQFQENWRLIRESFGCPILQQTILPVAPPLLGENEHRMATSPAGLVARLNAALRDAADGSGVELLAIDQRAAQDGIRVWHNPVLWHRAKQEISPVAAPLYGDLVARLIAAHQGRSAKCLVLDLDNTLWGGVVGDDGVEGLVLGQGSALGEAFVAFQSYAKELARRGIILAVCSKNDEANAWAPFDRHPEMVLTRADIACFVANWDDKATNLQRIARQLFIGLDALVFADDNPFERNLVRQAVPAVAVPELVDEPALFARTIADAGYFEAITLTAEDLQRSGLYQSNAARRSVREGATDLPAYLRGLEMRLVWRRFDHVGLTRVVQLINKTNQFNLTTRRYTEDEIREVMADERMFGLQLRLLDRFGDNGVIAIVIGRAEHEVVSIDTWLMSCRVLGRQVEEATLNLVVEAARRLNARVLVGAYRPTAKNAMVSDHYLRLGFQPAEDGSQRFVLDLDAFVPRQAPIDVSEDHVSEGE